MQRGCITNDDIILAKQFAVFLHLSLSSKTVKDRSLHGWLAGFKVKTQSCIFTWHKERPIDWTQKSEC